MFFLAFILKDIIKIRNLKKNEKIRKYIMYQFNLLMSRISF